MTDAGLFYLNPAHRLPSDLADCRVLVDLIGTLGDASTAPPPSSGAAGRLRAVALAAVAALALVGSTVVFVATHHPVAPMAARSEAASPLPATVLSASSATSVDPRTRLLFDRFLDLRVPVASQPQPEPIPAQSPRFSGVRVRIQTPAGSGVGRSWRAEPDPRAVDSPSLGMFALGPLSPDPARWPCPAAFPQWCRP